MTDCVCDPNGKWVCLTHLPTNHRLTGESAGGFLAMCSCGEAVDNFEAHAAGVPDVTFDNPVHVRAGNICRTHGHPWPCRNTYSAIDGAPTHACDNDEPDDMPWASTNQHATLIRTLTKTRAALHEAKAQLATVYDDVDQLVIALARATGTPESLIRLGAGLPPDKSQPGFGPAQGDPT